MFYLTSYEKKFLIFVLAVILFCSFFRFVNIERLYNKSYYFKDKVDINTATFQELKNIPYVGERLAYKIIDYRNNFGKFNSIEDLKKIKGIKDKKINIIKEYIKF